MKSWSSFTSSSSYPSPTRVDILYCFPSHQYNHINRQQPPPGVSFIIFSPFITTRNLHPHHFPVWLLPFLWKKRITQKSQQNPISQPRHGICFIRKITCYTIQSNRLLLWLVIHSISHTFSHRLSPSIFFFLQCLSSFFFLFNIFLTTRQYSHGRMSKHFITRADRHAYTLKPVKYFPFFCIYF